VEHTAEVVLPLTIRGLTRDDLPACAWTGSPESSFAAALDRAGRGEIDYLVICPPSGLPVAVGGVDYMLSKDAGTLYQLAVHGAVQSCGIGRRSQARPQAEPGQRDPGQRDDRPEHSPQ
jgi:hypothetical protein